MQKTQPSKLEMANTESTGFHEIVKNQKMVTKRNGQQEPFSLEELKLHLTKMSEGLDMHFIDVDLIANKVQSGLPAGKFPPLTNLHSLFCFRREDHPDC